MKILYITQHFPPETGAAQARAYETAKELAALGNDVTVVTGFPNYPSGIIPSKYRGKLFQTEYFDNMKVKRTFLVPDTKTSLKRRLLNYFSFMLSSILGGFSFKKYDVVYATSPQLFVGISGYVLSKLHRTKFVFEVRDLWVDFAEGLGQVKNKKILKKAKSLESFLYKKADLIITVTNGYKDRLIAQGVSKHKIKVITNGVDIAYYQPKQDNSDLRKKYGLCNKFVVLFAGNIGVAQGLDVVIGAAELLKKNRDIVFMLVGEGVAKQRLKNLAIQKELSNVIFEELQPRNKIIDYHNMSDVSLVCLRKFDLFNITIPSKTFDTLAMGKPILIGVDGEARKIIEQEKAGLFFEPENAVELTKCTLKLYRDRYLCKQMGYNARYAAEKKYQRKFLTKQLNDSIKTMLM